MDQHKETVPLDDDLLEQVCGGHSQEDNRDDLDDSAAERDNTGLGNQII